MTPRRSRILLVAIASGLAVGAVIFVATLPGGTPKPAAASPVAGCTRYPLFRSVWVCRGVVYLKRGRQMQFMGRYADLAPMPRAHGGEG